MPPSVQHLFPGPILAEGSIGGLIYVLAVIAFVVSKLARFRRQAQRSAPPPEAPPMPSQRPVDAELRELFESITGQKLAPPATPPPASASRPRAAGTPEAVARAPQSSARPTRRIHPSLQPQARPARAMPPPVPAPPPARPPRPPDPAPAAMPALERAPALSAAAPPLALTPRNTGGPALMLRLPSLRLGVGASGPSHAISLLDPLKSVRGLRAAIVQRAVLGPPRALEPME